MLRCTRCNIVILMAETTWVMSFSSVSCADLIRIPYCSSVPRENFSGYFSRVPRENFSGYFSSVPTENFSGYFSRVPRENSSGHFSSVPRENFSGYFQASLEKISLGTFQVSPEKIYLGTFHVFPEKISLGNFQASPEKISLGTFQVFPEKIYLGTFKRPQRKFLWGHLKSTVYESNPHTIQELKDIISHAVSAIKITMLHRVHLNMIRGVQLCTDAGGNHFQHLLWWYILSAFGYCINICIYALLRTRATFSWPILYNTDAFRR